MQTVVETPTFLSAAKGAGMTDAERAQVVDFIAANPAAGDVMEGTGGARKVRVAGKGKGKSGGYRVITFFGGGDIPVFLMGAFAKNQKANISDKEAAELKTILATLAARYRRRK